MRSRLIRCDGLLDDHLVFYCQLERAYCEWGYRCKYMPSCWRVSITNLKLTRRKLWKLETYWNHRNCLLYMQSRFFIPSPFHWRPWLRCPMTMRRGILPAYIRWLQKLRWIISSVCRDCEITVRAKEVLINSTNERNYEARGTQQARPINLIGEGVSIAQRCNSLVQSINQRFHKFLNLPSCLAQAINPETYNHHGGFCGNQCKWQARCII